MIAPNWKRMLRIAGHLAAALPVMLAGGCSDEFTASSTPTVVVIADGTHPDTLPHTGSAVLRVQVVESEGGTQTIPGATVRWRSSDSTIVRVVQDPVDGLNATLYADRYGSADITVEVTGGVGIAERQSLTKHVAVPEKWIEVSAGGFYSCGLSVDSLVYCWGGGGFLGNGTKGESTEPRRVKALEELQVKQISTGAYAACALEVGGLLYCWGENVHGEIGDESLLPRYLPVVGGGGQLFAQVSVGGDHSCARSQTSGWLICWGENKYGQVGTLVEGLSLPCGRWFHGPNFLHNSSCQTAPDDPVTTVGEYTPNAFVSSGGAHSCTVDEGRVYQFLRGSILCWGIAASGQTGIYACGIGGGNCPYPGTCFEPVVPSDSTFCWRVAFVVRDIPTMRMVSAGWEDDGTRPDGSFREYVAHTCSLTGDSLAYCWGMNNKGQVGTGSADTVPCTVRSPYSGSSTVDWPCFRRPVAVGPQKFSTIGAGARHTCSIGAADSLVYCWGDNSAGQLGDQTAGSRANAGVVPTPAGERFVKLSVGAWHSCAITARSSVIYCWGKNTLGQLGAGSTSASLGATRVREPT